MAHDSDTQPQPPAPSPVEEVGDEVRSARGGSPRILRWITALLYIWAIVYLMVHPRVESAGIVLIFAGILAAWFLFFTLTRRPSDL